MKYPAISTTILFIMILACSAGASRIINVPGDTENIQSAIDTAEPGDTIIVAPGVYQESIQIEKRVILKGAGVDATTLLGAIILKGADGVIIDGFTLDGLKDKDSHFGIWGDSSDMTISNSSVARYHHGISSQSSRTTIENCSVLENFNIGIEIQRAITALISGTKVSNNVGIGIRIGLSEDRVLVTDSFISGNRVGIDCIQSAPEIRRNVIKENKLGVQSSQDSEPDLGTDDSPGMNVIQDNDIHVMNMEPRHAIQAKNNYWGSHTGPDDSDFEGKIDFAPWLETDPLQTQTVRSRLRLETTWGTIKTSF